LNPGPGDNFSLKLLMNILSLMDLKIFSKSDIHYCACAQRH
jgi:hypothetical protein